MFINGIKNNDAKNNIPHITDVNPVRPPSVIPALPSTVETGGLHPSSAHPIVANDTAASDFDAFSGAPRS